MPLLSGDKPENLIQGETTNLAKIFTVLAAGVGAVAPAVVELFGDVRPADQDTFYLAAAAVMSVALLTVGLVYAADLRARTAVTRAGLEAAGAARGAAGTGTGTGTGTGDGQPQGPERMSAEVVALVPGSVTAVVRGSATPVTVVAVRGDRTDAVEYLVPRGDALAWVPARDVFAVTAAVPVPGALQAVPAQRNGSRRA